jgi:signal transduction histidine kinase
MWIYAGVSALLDCLPGMTLTLILFRKRLRFGTCATASACALLAVVQMAIGSLRYGHVDDNTYMALMAILLPVLWGIPVIGLIRDSWRKIVFVLMLFMNLSGTTAVIGSAVNRRLFPTCGMYDWQCLFMVLLIGTLLIGTLFALFGTTLLDLFNFEDADYIWRYLWLLPAGFSAIALWMRFSTLEPEYISSAKPANFMLLMVLFVTKLGTYLIIAKIILIQRQRNELSIVNQQYKLHEQAYRIYREHDDAERRLRHDFRHELAVLSVLAEQNEHEELRDYIAKMVRTIPSSARYRLAGNPELDALLQYYRYEAERTGVAFGSKIEVPIERYFASVDLTVVLGNLLENAVQAAGSGIAGQRYVDIRAREIENVCIIMVRNNYDGKLNAKNGEFLSTKHEGAGIGLESVKMIAKRLYGECSVDYTEHDFTVRVSVPMMPTGRDAGKA